jgi:hypothetical protein
MDERLFIVAMDVSDPSLELASMKAFLDHDESAKAWWNHIPGVFFIETALDAGELTDRIQHKVGKVRFVAVEVRPEQMNGLLPERSWDWLVKRSQAARKPQPAHSL